MELLKANRIVLAGAVVVGLILGGVTVSLLTGVRTAPDFSQYEAGPERKQAFFSYFLPIVQQVNQDILATRNELLDLRDKSSLSSSQESYVREVAEAFGLTGFEFTDADWATLLRRVDVVPPSLALAQAANESAWGTSRFAVEGNNYFGQWCFQPGCGIVPARRDSGKTHEVAEYRSPEVSVENYVRNLNQHNAYRQLREIRARLRRSEEPISGVALAGGLSKYSERGQDYIDELRQMIRFNELGEYDEALQVATAEGGDTPSG